MTELNELIKAEKKLICDKICMLLMNQNRNTKPKWEIRQEGQGKKITISSEDA